jgi:hypothetical protein
VGLNTLKSLNLTNVYPNNKKNNKVKNKPVELRSRVKINESWIFVCPRVTIPTVLFIVGSCLKSRLLGRIPDFKILKFCRRKSGFLPSNLLYGVSVTHIISQ